MAKRKPDSYWLNLIEQCRNSGLSDYQWCLENNMSFSTFYYHVNTLRKKVCEISPANPSVTVPAQQDVVQVKLINHTHHEPVSMNHPDSGSAVRLQLNCICIDISNHAIAEVIQNTWLALQNLC